MRSSRESALIAFVLSMAFASAIVSARADEPHWAFQPPVKPPVPTLTGTQALEARNAIDAFVLAAQAREGQSLAATADRPTLLRRLTFDLLGLPPTPDQLESFLEDRGPNAYERVVDRLLASPQHGERLAQHWLDLARYADSDGFEFDAVRPDAWRYRDWVARMLNQDLPHDEFIRRQMAGDELNPADPDCILGTGFHRAYPDMVDLNDQGLRRQNALNDITETTGLVFLGLTIGCARCHDHKYDPITIDEFYQLQAVFAPSSFADDYPLTDAGSVRPPRALPVGRVLLERGPTAPVTHVLLRGDFASKGRAVEPAVPAAIDPGRRDHQLAAVPSAGGSGRRLKLAEWLVRPGHPLTARVVVNRLWQNLLGEGLVSSSSDFGTQGAPPTHPELLDWLALELVNRGWSLRAIERLILTSATYRQSSSASPSAMTADPDNLLLTRQRRKRQDGEALRDALLLISGRLNPRMGGPGVFPDLPADLALPARRGTDFWPVNSDSREHERRSLYVFVRRNFRYPFFEVFDRPDTNASCPRRPISILAPQALSLMNSALAIKAAQGVADRIVQDPTLATAQERIDLAFRLVLGRPATEVDLASSQELLGPAGLDLQAWRLLALGLINLNEFVFID